MIAGLRLLPWVQYRRSEIAKDERAWPTKHQTWSRYLSCSDCSRFAEWGCGHMLERERCGQFVRPSGWPDDCEEVCPGYLISLPGVCEVAMLWKWYETGQLETRLDGDKPTRVLMTGLDVLSAARSDVEAHMLEAASAGKAG